MVLYPMFVHMYLELVYKGHGLEGNDDDDDEDDDNSSNNHNSTVQ